MLVSEAVTELRNKINDEAADGDFTDAELISFLNEGIAYISSYLITASNPITTKKATISASGTAVPDDFVKMAGFFPVKISGNVLDLIDVSKPVTIKYFANIPSVKLATDALPFKNSTFNIALIRIASIYALNQMQFNVAQDQAITTELLNLVNSAFGHAL